MSEARLNPVILSEAKDLRGSESAPEANDLRGSGPLPINCEICSGIGTDQDQFCQHCGYPFKGSQEEQRRFREVRYVRQDTLNGLHQKVKSASTTLFVLAGFAVVWAIAYGFMDSENPVVLVIIQLVVAAIDNPVTIFQGIIVKIIIIGYLIKGLNSALEAEKMRKQYNLS